MFTLCLFNSATLWYFLLIFAHMHLCDIMAWRRTGNKILPEPMMFRLPIHNCVTQPQWVGFNNLLKKQLIGQWWNETSQHSCDLTPMRSTTVTKNKEYNLNVFFISIMSQVSRIDMILPQYTYRKPRSFGIQQRRSSENVWPAIQCQLRSRVIGNQKSKW